MCHHELHPRKFIKEEGLKEVIVILASATVQNGAALAQPRLSCV